MNYNYHAFNPPFIPPCRPPPLLMTLLFWACLRAFCWLAADQNGQHPMVLYTFGMLGYFLAICCLFWWPVCFHWLPFLSRRPLTANINVSLIQNAHFGRRCDPILGPQAGPNRASVGASWASTLVPMGMPWATHVPPWPIWGQVVLVFGHVAAICSILGPSWAFVLPSCSILARFRRSLQTILGPSCGVTRTWEALKHCKIQSFMQFG